jgi:hypothetical protein
MERNHHPTQTLTDPHGETVEIDQDLAPLIELLWRVRFETISCCQDVGEVLEALVPWMPHTAAEAARLRGYAQVDFEIEIGIAFITALARSGPRDDFYVRMVHYLAPNAWAVSGRPDDMADDDKGEASDFDLWRLHVAFPWSDLGEIMRRLEAYEKGETVPPTPIDWSSIEVPDEALQPPNA